MKMLGRPKRAFTLIELLVVIAIIAILAAILFPVFAQARASARASSCLSNTKQFSLGVLMYAQDYDEKIPLLDNNGWNGDPGGSTPDWGDLTLAPGGITDSTPMFAGVVRPYLKNNGILYCPEIGRTNWRAAVADASNGVTWGGAYDPAKEVVYEHGMTQQAVNILLVEWGAQGAIAAFSRPAELVLTVGDSTWGWGNEMSYGLGNSGVWPSTPGTNCFQWGDGWTWYVHRANGRRGRTAGYSGFANAALADGHVKAYKYTALERCEFNGAGVWAYTNWDYRY
jgi:prepilin-type N-terminal cleavage/methylation domain-containing protein/prepilin-type processing-associated H-X9-DG protein